MTQVVESNWMTKTTPAMVSARRSRTMVRTVNGRIGLATIPDLR